MSDLVKPKSMAGQPQTMTRTNDNQFYPQKRPPSSKSSALSEIEMNHGGTLNKSGYPGAITGAQLMARRNNLMNEDVRDLSAT